MKIVNIIFIILLLFFIIFLSDDLKIKYFIQNDFRAIQWIIWSVLGIYFVSNTLDLHIYGFIVLFYLFYYSTIFYNKVMEYSFLQNILPNSFFEYQEKVEQYYQNVEIKNENNNSDIPDNNRNYQENIIDDNKVLKREDIIQSLESIIKKSLHNTQHPPIDIETNDEDRLKIQEILNQSFGNDNNNNNNNNDDNDNNDMEELKKKIMISSSISEMPNTIMREMSNL
jgi:hypothetical protein